MKIHFIIAFLVLSFISNAQYKIPYPTDAEALAKLKTDTDLNSLLKELNLTQADVSIKLKDKICLFPDSDESCHAIFREAKSIEGTNYWFTFEIKTLKPKDGMHYFALGYVYYTRLIAGDLTCKALQKFQYDGAKVDPFNVNSKNGFISVADAEKMVLDTLRKGYDWYANDRSGRDYKRFTTDQPEICRIDKLKTCEFGKENCTNNYRVKNIMYQQTHIITFETTTYEGRYEGGPGEPRSMFCLNSMPTLVYCEFIMVKGKPRFKSFSLMPDISNRKNLKECHYYNKPQDSIYVPMKFAGVDKVYGTFNAKPANANSLKHYRENLIQLSDTLQKLGKNMGENVALLSKYMTKDAAQQTAENYQKSILDKKAKIKSFKTELNEDEYAIKFVYLVDYGKKKQQEFTPQFGAGSLKWDNNQYLLDQALGF